MNNQHYDEAIELYQDMLKLFGRQAGILRSLAYVYYLKGDYDQSERFYLEVLSGDTLNLEYLHILGNIKSVKGEYDEAKRYYQKVISSDSTYTDSYVKLAQLEIPDGDLLMAQGYLEHALKQTIGSQTKVDIYSDLGAVYEKLGKAEEAKNSFQNAVFYARRFVVEFPDRSIPYLKLGESFFNVGQIDSAINSLQVAEFLEERPLHRGRVLLALGKAYGEKNDLPKAKSYFQEVLYLPVGFKERKEAERLLKSM
jgi:tetratricopeptide (TPR) repeat protein